MIIRSSIELNQHDISQRFPTKQNQASARTPRGSGPPEPEPCLRSLVCSEADASSGGLFLAFHIIQSVYPRMHSPPNSHDRERSWPSAKVGNFPEANLMLPAKRPCAGVWFRTDGHDHRYGSGGPEPRGWDVLADAWFSLWEIVGLSLWLSSIKVLWLLILIIRKQLCFYALKIVFDSLVRFFFFGLKEKKKN